MMSVRIRVGRLVVVSAAVGRYIFFAEAVFRVCVYDGKEDKTDVYSDNNVIEPIDFEIASEEKGGYCKRDRK